MQGGVTASQTQSFVESVSAQFEKLFKNLDQIGETKVHDGVTKRNKLNPSKLAGGANLAEQKNPGLFGES